MDISIDDIRKLSPEIQLSIAEQIWDGLLLSGHLPSESQITEVRRRVKELGDDPSIALTEEDMWKKVDELRNAKRK